MINNLFLCGVGCQCLALSADIYPSRRALALLGDMKDQDRNTRNFYGGTGSYKKNMNMDVTQIDPMDLWHGMMVNYCPIGLGGYVATRI